MQERESEADQIRYLLQLSGLTVPGEDVPILRKLLEGHLSITRVLLEQDYTDCVPAAGVRWHE